MQAEDERTWDCFHQLQCSVLVHWGFALCVTRQQSYKLNQSSVIQLGWKRAVSRLSDHWSDFWQGAFNHRNCLFERNKAQIQKKPTNFFYHSVNNCLLQWITKCKCASRVLGTFRIWLYFLNKVFQSLVQNEYNSVSSIVAV